MGSESREDEGRRVENEEGTIMGVWEGVDCVRREGESWMKRDQD